MTESAPAPQQLVPTLSAAESSAAEAVFGDALQTAHKFVGHLATSGMERGLLGPREVPRLWNRHVLNCAVIAEFMEPESTVVDVGSGAGLPGLAVAIARPDLQLHLVEPLERRVAWLNEVIGDLELKNVVVHRARAEDMVGEVSGRYVTARAVAALSTLAGWTLPLVAAGGEVLAIKGRSAEQEFEKARKPIRKLGGSAPEILLAGTSVLEEPTTVVRILARRS